MNLVDKKIQYFLYQLLQNILYFTLRLAAWKDNNQVIYLPSYPVSIRIITLSTQSIKYLIQMYYYQNATKSFKLEEKSSEIEYTTMKFCVMIDYAPVGNSNSS